MTGGPWEISDDPDNPWAIRQEDWDAVDNPLRMTLAEGLAHAVSLGFPDDDERFHRMKAAIEVGEELTDDDGDDLINWLTAHDDQGDYNWTWDDDGFALYPTAYLADM